MNVKSNWFIFFSGIIVFISPCSAFTSLEIHRLYKQLEEEAAQICYKETFEKDERLFLKDAIKRNLPHSIYLKKLNFKEPLPAYNQAVLVSVVKDEEDIIFENLCWHYFMGFRKFIVVDNGSTDATGQLIDRFKELTASSASVIKIDDPDVSFKQASRMNGCFRLAEKIFPEITWIFPNDADEFMVFDASIENTLSVLSPEVNGIHSPRISYLASDDYFDYKAETPFYESIHVGHKHNVLSYSDDSQYCGKTCLRAHQGLMVIRGFHFVSSSHGAKPRYVSGLDCGMHIREFPVRSPSQAIKKFINRAQAQKAFENCHKEFASRDFLHQKYKRYLEIGDAYGMEEFKSFMARGGYSFDERMPIERALKAVDVLFCEQPHEHWKDPNVRFEGKKSIDSFYERGRSKGKIKA